MSYNYGYACINTELRKKKIFMSRTCRLDTYKTKGFEYVKSLCIQNLKDILTMLEWNVKNNIYFMRLSSEIFPFASHIEYGYSIEFAKDLLEEIGDYAKLHKIRLTMHPGQYCVLSSSDERIIKNAVNDLIHHADILNYMNCDQNSVMIIHGGGVYGNKKKALEKLKENILNLPENVRNRLVLENCEMSYCVEDLLPISEELKIPIVLDFHHDSIYSSSQNIEYYFDRVFSVWKERGIKPKIHISNSLPDVQITDSKTMRRKHSDYIYFIHEAVDKINIEIDIMLEAKMKEQAVLELRMLEEIINQ